MDDAAWDSVRLVVFDVDGTLYRQSTLRLRMAREMALAAVVQRSLTAIHVVRAYRRLREHVGEVAGFEQLLIAQTAAHTGVQPDRVTRIVQEWIEQRPLPHLAGCRYLGVAAVFAGLRQAGKRVAVLSDYPARAKLAALGLHADPIVYAGDEDVGVLKPNPRGLQAVISRAGATPGTTLLIGDRPDRDGEAARRAGSRALIRSRRARPGWECFARFDDPLFGRFLAPE